MKYKKKILRNINLCSKTIFKTIEKLNLVVIYCNLKCNTQSIFKTKNKSTVYIKKFTKRYVL